MHRVLLCRAFAIALSTPDRDGLAVATAETAPLCPSQMGSAPGVDVPDPLAERDILREARRPFDPEFWRFHSSTQGGVEGVAGRGLD